MPAYQPKPNNYPPMDASEYEFVRQKLELSGVDFARLVGVSWRAGQRYQAGGKIPNTVARLVRTIIRHKLSPDEVG